MPLDDIHPMQVAISRVDLIISPYSLLLFAGRDVRVTSIISGCATLLLLAVETENDEGTEEECQSK